MFIADYVSPHIRIWAHGQGFLPLLFTDIPHIGGTRSGIWISLTEYLLSEWIGGYSKRDQNSEFGEIMEVEDLWVVTKPKGLSSPEEAEEVVWMAPWVRKPRSLRCQGMCRVTRETVKAFPEESCISKLLDSPKETILFLTITLTRLFLLVSPTCSSSAPSRVLGTFLNGVLN